MWLPASDTSKGAAKRLGVRLGHWLTQAEEKTPIPNPHSQRIVSACTSIPLLRRDSGTCRSAGREIAVGGRRTNPVLALTTGDLLQHKGRYVVVLRENVIASVHGSHPQATARLEYIQSVAMDQGIGEQLSAVNLVRTVFDEVEQFFQERPRISDADNEAIEKLVPWFDEVFESLPTVEPDFLMPLALMRFRSIVPNHLLMAAARYILREISDPQDRLVGNKERLNRLMRMHTDKEIRQLIHRQEGLLQLPMFTIPGS